MSGPKPPSERAFNENSPRPPVPGEEGEVKGSRSKDPQARRSNCDASCAPLGYEPEGHCDLVVIMERESSTSTRSRAQLACLQWPQNFHALLRDPKGVKCFEDFLQQEGDQNALLFWFACEGLKDEVDPEKLTTIIKAVIRTYIQRPQLAVPDEIRKDLTQRYHDGQSDKDMFDLAQKKVYQYLEKTAYPNFLRSEFYVKHLQHCQSTDTASTVTSSNALEDVEREDKECYSSPDEPPVSCSAKPLPTVHEDSELKTQHHPLQPTHTLHHQSQLQHTHQHYHHPQQQLQQQHQQQLQQHQQQLQQQHHHHHGSQSSVSSTDYKQGEMRLTKDMLMATQQLRALEVRPKPEAYAGVYLHPGAPYHAGGQRRAHYSSYNPVSRQDSELQSLSSDARTESDNLSLNDASLSDSASITRRNIRKQHQRHTQQMKKSAMMNRETDIHDTIIPRTQLLSREHTQPKHPQEFARLLCEKLERVKRDQDNEEMLMRKLWGIEPSETDEASAVSNSESICDSMNTVVPKTVVPKTVVPNRSITDALLQVEEDSDQAILDQHVSRVWSDLTPSRSPKLASPRPRSPDKNRRQAQIPSQPQVYPPRSPTYRSQRKEKDVFSTFSGDSGNVHDFSSSEIYGVGSMSSLGSHLPKSKSVPSEYAESLHTQDMYLQGQDQRYRRLDAQRSSATKKSMTELTDSGVSVVSYQTTTGHKDRLLNLFKKDASCSSGVKAETMNVNKLNRNKKFANSPQQPFIGDPGMPLLPQPHTATQLEEAKRRLEYEQYEQNRGKQLRYPSSETMLPSIQTNTASNQSTLRRGGKQDTPSDFTTVVFSFCDEKVPYRTKISGTNITLKQFKDVLPKKGSYRYFFKTECEDLDMKVIQEEITDDNEQLPMWDNKIMAQVKALE